MQTATVSANVLTNPAWITPLTRNQKLQAWLDSKKQLDDAKNIEAAARVAVIEAFPFDADVEEGTQTIDLANNYKLKVVKRLNYKLDPHQTNDALDKLEKTDATGKFIAERLVKWKPDLSISEYRALKSEHKKIIDEVLTTSPGMPTLELVEPKVKK
jgi:hypothetical protein